MTAPPTPGPDDASALSLREQAILDRIEDDFREIDPGHQHTLAAGVGAWSPISAGQGALLVLALVLLTVTAALLPASWWVLLAPLTVMLLGQWMVLCAIQRHRGD